MANKLIMIPAICAALISDHSESKKRESLTRYLLKYHARPGGIGNSPYIARQFSIYNLGQSPGSDLKDLSDQCCNEGAVTLFLTAMWNSILLFESDAKRFKRVVSSLGQAEMEMTSEKGLFKKVLGELTK